MIDFIYPEMRFFRLKLPGRAQPARSLREEFGMLEYHYEVPNLSPRRYQIQVPVNYVSYSVKNSSACMGEH